MLRTNFRQQCVGSVYIRQPRAGLPASYGKEFMQILQSTILDAKSMHLDFIIGGDEFVYHN